MATVTVKYIKLSTGNCYQVPANWSGQVGTCVNENLAAQNGLVLDVNCSSYNAANNPTCTGGSCFIAITAASYNRTQEYVEATVSTQGLTGAVQYSADGQQWYSSPNQIRYLEVGSYTLYVRDAASPGCNSQRAFTVS